MAARAVQQIFGPELNVCQDGTATDLPYLGDEFDHLALMNGRDEINAMGRRHDDHGATAARRCDESRLSHHLQRVAAIEGAIMVRLAREDHVDHMEPAIVCRRGVLERRQGQARVRPLHRHEREAPARAEAPLGVHRTLRNQLDLDIERTAPDADDAGGRLDHLASMSGRGEIDLFRRGGDEWCATMARGREKRDLVHMGKRHASEQRAMVIGVRGEDHIDQLQGGGGRLGHGDSHGSRNLCGRTQPRREHARARLALAKQRPDRAPRRWSLSRRRQVSWLTGRHVGPGLSGAMPNCLEQAASGASRVRRSPPTVAGAAPDSALASATGFPS